MSNIKILIVDDDIPITWSIKDSLIDLGYKNIDIAHNYSSAIELFKKRKHDILLLDIHLNDSKDGIDIAFKALEIKEKTAILYISCDDSDEIIDAITYTKNQGFIPKSAYKNVLKSAVVRAIKMVNQDKDKYNQLVALKNGYYYDLTTENLFMNDSSIKLSKNEKKLIRVLINNNRYVSKEILYEEIWFGVEKPDALRNLIKRLRGKTYKNFVVSRVLQGYKISL